MTKWNVGDIAEPWGPECGVFVVSSIGENGLIIWKAKAPWCSCDRFCALPAPVCQRCGLAVRT